MCLNKHMPRRKESRMNLIGAELRRQRNLKNLNQTFLAASCQRMGWDVSRETITRIETYRRLVSDFEICILATALGISPKVLLPDAPDLSEYLKQGLPTKYRESEKPVKKESLAKKTSDA